MNVLIVAAHPDDEVLGCGGTIPRLVQEGHQVSIAILGEGITSRYDDRSEADQHLVKELEKRSQQVADLLGAETLFTYDLPDNRFDTVPLLDVVKIVEELIEKVQPEVIYTHHGGDLNIDHVITHRAVLTATRPQSDQPVKEIITFEVPSSTEWAFNQFETFTANMFININKTLELKIEAMQLYESEARTFPHPRSPKTLHALAEWRGSQVGLIAAEAFECVRVIIR
jgi:LmbE family N-acetylglucosaminyl deacetylase